LGQVVYEVEERFNEYPSHDPRSAKVK